MPDTEICGVVLAGGKSARMAGADKALATLGGETLVSRALRRLAPQVSALAVSTNSEDPRMSALGVPLLNDSVPGFAGPMAGLLAAMDWAASRGAKFVLTVPVDTPFFPEDLATRFMDNMTGDAVIAASGPPGGPMRHHPVVGLWRPELRDDLRKALLAGDRKIRLWAARHHAAVASFEEENGVDPFYNINTDAALQAAREYVDATA